MPHSAQSRRWLSYDPAEPVSHTLDRKRVYILPSRTGLFFAIVLIVMLIGSINYELSLGHALVFLLAGLGFVSMIHTYRNLVGLKITSGYAKPVFCGETAYFPLHLEDMRTQERRSLHLAFGKNEYMRVDIFPDKQLTSSLPHPASSRGRLNPGNVTLSTTYPLGLFTAWSSPAVPFECLVYPEPIAAPLPPAIAVAQSGEQPGEKGQEDFSGLRQWQTNDSPKHIAWKAVAKNMNESPLLVKEFSGGAMSELWLDWSIFAENTPGETRLSILTGWILEAESIHVRYGLTLPGITIDPDHGPSHRAHCLEILALYDLAKT